MDDMQVLTALRKQGKTTQAIRWMLGGQKIDGYPGWDRVLVVMNLQRVDEIRRQLWGKVEDIDHRVYPWRVWRGARNVSDGVQVVIDEIANVLRAETYFPGRLAGFTVTGQPWETLDEVEIPVHEVVKF